MKKTLSTLCFASLALTACNRETIKLNPPPPPASYMTCEQLPAVPDIEPLTAYNTGDVQVYLKPNVDQRDGEIARWIVDVRGAWFSCWNQLAKVRDYYAEMEKRGE